jgi:hypothetical protein
MVSREAGVAILDLWALTSPQKKRKNGRNIDSK